MKPSLSPRLSEAERQVSVVASTFANMELYATQQTQVSTFKLLQRSEEECERLRGLIDTRDRDSLEVVNFLQEENKEKSNKISLLEQQLRDLELSALKRDSKSRDAFLKLVASKDSDLKKKEEEISRLQQELSEAARYQRERFEMARQIEQLRQSEVQMVEEYEQKLSRLKFSTVEERVKIRAMEEELTAAFQNQVEQRALVVAKLKNEQVHSVNERLEQTNHILSQEISTLVALASKYQQDLSSLRRDISISDGLHEDALRHTASLKSKVRSITAQRTQLEEDKRTIQLANSLDRDAQTKAYERTIDSLREQLCSAQTSNRQLQSELKRLKELSATVLDQRGELEQFFYKAIEFVRMGQTDCFRESNERPLRDLAPVSALCTTQTVESRLPRLLGSARSKLGSLSPRTSPRSTSAIFRPPAPPVELPSNMPRRGSSSQRLRQLSADQASEVDIQTRNINRIRKEVPPLTQKVASPPQLHPQARPRTVETASTTTESFSSMPWSEKESVIKALLAYMNVEFYDRKGKLIAATMLEGAGAEWGSSRPAEDP